jgi:hypothetical protein
VIGDILDDGIEAEGVAYIDAAVLQFGMPCLCALLDLDEFWCL